MQQKNIFILLIIGIGLTYCSPDQEEATKQELTIIELNPLEAAENAVAIRNSIAAEVNGEFNLSLWASDSLIMDPVAISFDDQGNVYYTSANRRRNSEIDIRRHRDWAIASIGFQSVEDRRQFLRKTITPENSTENSTWLKDENRDSIVDWRDLTVLTDEVYRIEDKSGDGIADFAQLYADGFNTEVTDVANGVKFFNDEVYLAIAPDLWRLTDSDGDGMSDQRTSISHGYGVHIGFGGHNLSGVTVGPDGRLYWGIGDIGINVTDQDGKQWMYPNQGVIVRANPDGSDFEVFAHGLRNTHEFVFDEFGNIISEDNDGDHPGEMERLVYIVNGSDTGWRINWQFGKYRDPDNNDYKVWMDEGMDKPRFEGQAAYFIPTIKNYRNGPTGMAYNPGTALGEKWRNHFFLAEFVGASSRSTINAFRLEPKGAGFEFVDEAQLVKGVLATGIDIGPDGALYFSDWIEGWEPRNNGRIWKLDLNEISEEQKQLRAGTQQTLALNFRDQSNEALAGFLQHPDMRIRQKAQFELVSRKNEGGNVLLTAARQTEHRLARIHGIWGIAQLARVDNTYAPTLLPFLSDEDPEVVAQAAKMIGDIRFSDIGPELLPLLSHPSLRVQFFAAEALGRIAYKPAIQPLIDLLEVNNDQDVYLRHAGTLALARIGDAKPIIDLAKHESRAVRIAAVVSLRRMRHPGVAHFLADEDEYIVTETARAINDDWSIEGALSDLAMILEEPRFSNEALIRRAINANLRLGEEDNIELLANFAVEGNQTPAMRAEAIATLGVWPKPSVLDRVTGRFRGPIERDPTVVKRIFAPIADQLLREENPAIQAAAIKAAGKLGITAINSKLFALLKSSADKEVRTASIEALQLLEYPQIQDALQIALADRSKEVRVSAMKVVQSLNLPPDETVPLFSALLKTGSVQEKQAAIAALGSIDHLSAQEVLAQQLTKLSKGTLELGIQLELEEAVADSDSDALREMLSNYESNIPEEKITEKYIAALEGGNARQGYQIFNGHETAQCTRCHKISGEGSDVGPSLAGVASRLSRRQLLQSMVHPSAVLAPGYGVVTLTLKNGESIVGFLQEENTSSVKVKLGADEFVDVAKKEITERQTVPSSMPPMGELLEKRELRDLVAYLSTLQ